MANISTVLNIQKKYINRMRACYLLKKKCDWMDQVNHLQDYMTQNYLIARINSNMLQN